MDKLLQNLVLLEHLHRNLQQTKQKDLENVSFDEEEISFINDTYKDEEKSIFYQKNKYMYELLKNGYQLQADKNKLIVYVDDVKIVGDKGKVLSFPNTKEERQTLTQNIIKDFCIYESNSQEETKENININETNQNTTVVDKNNEIVENQQNKINDIEDQTNEENTEIPNNYSEEENNDIYTESNDVNSDDSDDKEKIKDNQIYYCVNNQIVHNTNTDVNTNTNDKINEGFYFDLGENGNDDLLNNINFNENLFNGENENNSENKENHENKEKTEIDNNEKSENKDNKTNSLFNFDNHNDFNFMNNFNEEFMDDNLDIDLTENDLGEIDFVENDLTKNDFNKNDLNKNINLEETNLENYDENNLIKEELNKIMNEPNQELFVFNDNKSNDLTNEQKEVYIKNENINNNKILNDNDTYNDANDTDTNTDSDIDNINVDFNLEDLENGNFDFNFSDENNDKSNEEENENELNANENNLSDSETNENSEANENQNIDKNENDNSNDEPNENSDLDENKFDDDNFIFNFNEENLENETLFNFGESENNNVDLSNKEDNTNLNIHSNVDDTQNDKNSNENSNDNSIFNKNPFSEEKTVLETPIFKEPEKPKLNFITNTIDEDSLTMLEKLKEDKEDYDLSMLETLINEDFNNKEEVFNLSLGNFEQKEFDLEKENEKLNLVADEVINNSKNDTLINAKLNDTTISDPINDPINDPIKNTENVDSENEKEIKNDNLTLSGKEENEKLTDYFVSAMQEESDFRREKTKFIKDIVNIEIDFTDGNYHKVDNLRMVIFPLNTASNGTDIATDICAYVEQDDGYIIEYMLPQSKRIIEFHNNDYVIFVKGFWENGQFGSQVRIFSNKGEIKTNIETTKIRPDNNENLGIGHNVIFLDYATTLHLMPIEKQDGTIPVIGVTIKNIGFGESSGDSKLGDPTMIVSGETYKYEVSGYWKDDYFEVNSQIYTPKNMN